MAPLRDRVTADLYYALQAACERWRQSGRVNRVEDVEIVATVTEAWQESGRDYVTARITGSVLDYILEEAQGAVLEGSRTVPRPVEERWTFTRPAGLNFWMLSAIGAATGA
jgi:predicted lipid-binding transport protein (Tim44 family)